MKKKKPSAISPRKEELQKELKKKNTALERLKRELKIEASLEKVRERTMAMQRSNELQDAASLMVQQIQKLGVPQFGSGFNIWDDDRKAATAWMCNITTDNLPPPFKTSSSEDIFLDIHDAAQRGESLFVKEQSGKELETHYKYMNSIPIFKEYVESASHEGLVIPEFQIMHCAFFSQGYLMFITYKPVPKAYDIFKRFAKVFEQTYTRFLDLQKAEEQARESQIQLAMERVRARTMAMQRSDELSEASGLLFQQVQSLGAPSWTAGYCIWDEDKKAITLWMSSPSGGIQPPFRSPLDENPTFMHYLEADNKGMELYIEEESGKVPEENYQYLLKLPVVSEILNALMKEGYSLPTYQVDHCAYFSKGFLLFITYQQVPELHDIFKRFAAVFDQTYTRFLDLQKAETQARESQIQLALERVRARTMAMQHSDELADASHVLERQVAALGLKTWSCAFHIFRENDSLEYHSSADGVKPTYVIPRTYIWQRYYEGCQRGETLIIEERAGGACTELYEYLAAMPVVGEELQKMKAAGIPFPTYQVEHAASFKYGYLFFITFEQVPEAHNIFIRFAKVFEQTYTRFLDLQKAEEQAREATIEAALEKVRGKAMAMRTSSDLSATASMVFTELRKLGISPIRSGVGILNKESRKAQLYSATSSPAGDSLSLVGWIMLTKHPVAEKIYDSWLMNENYFPELSGEQLKSYYENLLSGLSLPSVPDWKGGQKQYGTFLSFSVGCLYAWSEIPYNDDEIKILKRFGTIIDLTFRRYMELQKSETNAKEAVRQASLDRVRAEIASMRTIADLDRITPLIWNELNILGVPFSRCGVFIMDESQEIIHTFLSTPEGKAIAAFPIPYATPGNIMQVLYHWQQKSTYIDHWDEATFTDFADTLVRQGAIPSSDQYLKTIPHGGFNLHFLPFLQGMLYVGNNTRLGEDEMKLVQSVADAFSTAYARYEDFNKLEAAKKQVDSTLNELQVTQKQLIQSEKMASLGELTAGIAHEIQNPLNFVNNFSEVNKELIEELKNELASDSYRNGNQQLAIEIANDIAGNEEKISHHGKRADSIVKGMLQHSRSTSTTKEPTDINALADEYLRLAYHGLRAKDKFFNVTLKTDFDETIGKINIIPQDIGRVLLNLYNNAFYAVKEKAAGSEPQATSYEPVVTVRTKKPGDRLEIQVEDNGNGIPQKIVDKIFQPFFTTKPTGQGTGLGLSLSYDIIKAHAGELKVETKEDEGSEFIIMLPIV